MHTAKARKLATPHVAHLHGLPDEVRAYLVRVCLGAARCRYLELKEVLEGRRLQARW